MVVATSEALTAFGLSETDGASSCDRSGVEEGVEF